MNLQGTFRIGSREFNDPINGIFQKSAIMADHEKSGWTFGKTGSKEFFQPEDAFDIQMVGGLIHDQDIGVNNQGPADGQPLAPAAG